ncbi:hypothetical protein [Enorma massiliensis]|uniref:hypothetical protein n=1 Tax=Enorma massiliensis TaxID=1472761 RepID=UPI003A90372F
MPGIEVFSAGAQDAFHLVKRAAEPHGGDQAIDGLGNISAPRTESRRSHQAGEQRSVGYDDAADPGVPRALAGRCRARDNFARV